MSASRKRFLNVGCGRRFHDDWVNIDLSPTAPGVLAHDVRRGIPFADGSFDVVYHSHVLEHFSPNDAGTFLRECHRVLRPGGIIRVAVPDLETISRLYLQALDRARTGDTDWQHHYDWMMIELYDQTVRETSGGGHGAYIQREDVPNLDFVLARQGEEVQNAVAARQARKRSVPSASPVAASSVHSGSRLKRTIAYRTLRYVWHRLKDIQRRSSTAARRERRIARLLGAEYELLKLGRFRRSGEVHQWMYDSYSLSRVLTAAGFVAPRQVQATESLIADWRRFCLDADTNGQTYKPDSLFMEAIKNTEPSD
jgi:predicted SAM-dependent methyltransferase